MEQIEFKERLERVERIAGLDKSPGTEMGPETDPVLVPNRYSVGIPPLRFDWIYWFARWPFQVHNVRVGNVTPHIPYILADIDPAAPTMMHQYYTVRENTPIPPEAGPYVGECKLKHGGGVTHLYRVYQGLIDDD